MIDERAAACSAGHDGGDRESGAVPEGPF